MTRETMIGVAAELRCDPEGLHAFAGACESHAAEVEARLQLDLPNTTQQYTVVAVSRLHTASEGAGTTLARRIRSTADAVRAAADRYARTDEESADAVGDTVSSGGG